MKKRILFLTNLKNGDPEEDLFLSDYLKDYFDVTICHPLQSKEHLKKADLILSRNIWPVEDYLEDFNKTKILWDKSKIKVSPSLNGKGDQKGKEYLAELYNEGFPVIPTIKDKEQLSQLGDIDSYFVKPIYGGSSKGCKVMSKREVLTTNLNGFIIQPKLDIKEEVSFYFIDNKLQYSLYTPNKEERWNLKPFTPTKEEIALAIKFVKYNNLKQGIQRIDFCRLHTGELLLMEIEDLCPYLSLLDIDASLREKFLQNLVSSLQKIS